MSMLNKKIDFVALTSVNRANANGDPLNGNRPRTDYSGYGEMSDVCIKRKIRNRMQDLCYPVFVQSEDRCDDGFGSLSERAGSVMKGRKTGRNTRRRPVKPGWMCALSARCLPLRIRSRRVFPSAFGVRYPSIRL